MSWHRRLSQTPVPSIPPGSAWSCRWALGAFPVSQVPAGSCWVSQPLVASQSQEVWVPCRQQAGSAGRDPQGKGSAREGIRNGLQHAAVSWLTKHFQDPAAEQARTHGQACRGRTDTRLGMPCRHRARCHLPSPPHPSLLPSRPSHPLQSLHSSSHPSIHPSFCPCPCACGVCVSVSEGWAPCLSPQDPGAPGAEGCFSFPLAGIQLLSLVFPFSFSPGIRPL